MIFLDNMIFLEIFWSSTYRELPLGRPQLRITLMMRSHLLHVLLDEELAAGSCHLD